MATSPFSQAQELEHKNESEMRLELKAKDESRTYAFELADKYIHSLIKAMSEHQLTDIPKLREKTAKPLFKAAFFKNDSKLYAYLTKKTLEVCTNAFQRGDSFLCSKYFVLECPRIPFCIATI